jgi:hypothetical protein
MVITDDPQLAAAARIYLDQGKGRGRRQARLR